MRLLRYAILPAVLVLLPVGVASAQYRFPQYQPTYPGYFPGQPHQGHPHHGHPHHGQPHIGHPHHRQPQIGFPQYPGAPIGIPVDRRGLERQVEHSIRAAFGPFIDDVDVDIDVRKRRAKVEVELEKHGRHLRFQVYNFVHQLPQLAGFRLKVEVDD